MIEVREATLDDVEFVADNLRPEDEQEVAALTSAPPRTALKHSFLQSHENRVVLVDGVPAVVFGVADSPGSPAIGTVWLLATPDIEKIPWEFAKQSKRYLEEMFATRTYRVLRNYVFLENLTHVRWLLWLGAKFLGPKIRGFRRFEIYR